MLVKAEMKEKKQNERRTRIDKKEITVFNKRMREQRERKKITKTKDNFFLFFLSFITSLLFFFL